MGQGLGTCLEKTKEETTVCVVGLSGVGKTTACLRILQREDSVRPTGVEECMKGNHQSALRLNRWKAKYSHESGHEINMQLIDLGGKVDHQVVWSKYYANVRAMIYVFDASSSQAFEDAVTTFRNHVLPHTLGACIPLLILGNIKDDIVAVSQSTAIASFGLYEDDSSNWHYQQCSALTGEGLDDGIAALSRMAERNTQQHLESGFHKECMKVDIDMDCKPEYTILCYTVSVSVMIGYYKKSDDVGDVEKLLMRLVGCSLSAGGFLSIIASQIFGIVEKKCCVIFISIMSLGWTLVHGVEGVYISADEFDKTTTITNCGIGVAMLLLNSLSMTAAIWFEIPEPQPNSVNLQTEIPQQQHTRIFTINEDPTNNDISESARVPFIRELEQPKKKSSRVRLLSLAKPEYKIIIAGCVALCIRLPFSLSIPHFVSECIGALIKNDQDEAVRNVVLLLIAGTVDAMLDFWNFFLFGFAQQRLIRRLRTRVFSTFLSQEIGFFDSSPTGDMLSRLQSDTSEMGNDLTWVFRWTIEAAVRIMGIIAYMFIRDYRLAWVTVAVIPVCAVINRFYGAWLEKNAVKVQKSLAEANSVAQEVLASVRTVFSFNTQRFESDRYETQIESWYQLNVKQVAMQAVYYMVISTFLVNTVVQASILFYGVHLVIHEGMQPSVLLAFMLYQGDLQNWVTNLLNSFTNLIKSSGAGEKVFELLDRKNRLQSSEGIRPEFSCGYVSDSDERSAVVELHSVHFKYETREHPVLRGINLSVYPGNVVALVGQSGAGKSTIFHLLEHFYDPSMGQVLINGEAVSRIDPQWLHSNVAIVGQEPVLFSGSILRNILYALLDQQPTLMEDIEADSVLYDNVMSKVHRAAEIANAKVFIEDLPDRYLTEVGEKGVQLSGGQKQRIAIARALVQDPKIVLLDEATSALDATSEQHVQQALEAATKDRTTIVIAHRLSTVARADCICVMDGGVIVEMGTHEELMNRPDNPDSMSYKKLVQRQMEP